VIEKNGHQGDYRNNYGQQSQIVCWSDYAFVDFAERPHGKLILCIDGRQREKENEAETNGSEK
jgi:hypothetical protein